MKLNTMLFMLSLCMGSFADTENPSPKSQNTDATTYHGFVIGKVSEINGHEYSFYGPSEFSDGQSFGSELFFGLDQNSGQKLYWSKQGSVVEASADNKYLVSVSINETGEDRFDASVKLYITAPKHKSNQTTSIDTKEIGTYQVEGSLNAKNEYNFIDDGKHNFYLKIEIDKIFTEDEKKARLLQKQTVAK